MACFLITDVRKMPNGILEQTIFGDCSVFTHEDLVDYLKTAGLEEVKR